MKTRGLNKNRGLDFLLAEIGHNKSVDSELKLDAFSEVCLSKFNDSGVLEVPLEQIIPGRFQPRQEIKREELEPLINSISTHGVLQPILVWKSNNVYEIIAGERRFQAARLTDLKTIPVIVKNVDEQTAMFIALVENIQRQDLNIIEEAKAYQRLAEQYNLTHDLIADAVGKKRATITNVMRILNLSQEVQSLLNNGQIEFGHAKLLLTLDPKLQIKIAEVISSKHLSVRATEQYINNLSNLAKARANQLQAVDPDLVALERKLSDQLQAKVVINHHKDGSGKLIINYNSVDELEGVLERVK